MKGTISFRERSLELSDLALFKTVAEAGSVTGAGERLHRVQSNVTARVKWLESHLGIALFVRGRRGMSLTPEGRRLLDYADRLLALAEEARAELSASEPSGRLLIGSMESTAAVHLPRLLSTLHAKYPALEVQLVTATSGALLAQLRAGEISAAFVSGDIEEAGLVADPAYIEELVLVAHPSTRLGARVDDLRGKTLVTFGAGCAYRACIEGWLATQGVRPPRTLRSRVLSRHARLRRRRRGLRGGAEVRAPRLQCAERRESAPAGSTPLAVTTWLVRRAGDRSRAVDALRQLVASRAPATHRRPGPSKTRLPSPQRAEPSRAA